MIGVFTGLPSSGKSYLLTKFAKNQLESGRIVYANQEFALKDKRVRYFKHFEELDGVTNGLIIVDEMQVRFNSRNWERLDESVQYQLQQHAKDGLDIWGTVQHESRLDVILRELVAEFIHCTLIAGSSRMHGGKPWGLIVATKYYPEDMLSRGGATSNQGREFHFIRKEICDFYDTRAKAKKDGEKNVSYKKMKWCANCKKWKDLGFVSASPHETHSVSVEKPSEKNFSDGKLLI